MWQVGGVPLPWLVLYLRHRKDIVGLLKIKACSSSSASITCKPFRLYRAQLETTIAKLVIQQLLASTTAHHAPQHAFMHVLPCQA